MSALYLYAVIGGAPRGPLGRGVGGERLRVVAAGRLHVVVGTATRPPRLDEAALRRQDAVVRRIGARVDALLPIRFGTRVDDEAALARALRPRSAALRSALALVAGREQMTLRVLGDPAAAASPVAPRRGAPAAGGGPGTRYLRGRARAGQVPELEPVRKRLAPLVCAERAVRAGPDAALPTLLASVYHLIPRGRAAAYRRAVAGAAALPPVAGLLVSGPFAPYAFAPELPC